MPIVHLLLVTPIPTPVNAAPKIHALVQGPALTQGLATRPALVVGPSARICKVQVSQALSQWGLASWGERDCVWVFSLSRVRFFATPWTVAHQRCLAVEVSRQKYRSRWPFPTPGESSRTKDRTSRARQTPHHRASREAPRYT